MMYVLFSILGVLATLSIVVTKSIIDESKRNNRW